MAVSAGKADTATARRNEQRLRKIVVGENAKCSDCRQPLSFDSAWASINIGAFLCIKCSGVHRSIGTHLSKVRAAKADDWNDDWVDNMELWGNERCAGFWEARLGAGQRPPQDGAASEAASRPAADFIRAKYDKRLFAADGEPGAWHACLALANGWSRMWDAESAAFYYAHTEGGEPGETVWELPAAAAPPALEPARWWAGFEGWLEKKSGGATEKSGGLKLSNFKASQKWDKRYFVLATAGSKLSYYTSADAFRRGEPAAGEVECKGGRFFLKEISKGVHRFTVHSAERELKMRAPAAEYRAWVAALRPVLGEIEMP